MQEYPQTHTLAPCIQSNRDVYKYSLNNIHIQNNHRQTLSLTTITNIQTLSLRHKRTHTHTAKERQTECSVVSASTSKVKNHWHGISGRYSPQRSRLVSVLFEWRASANAVAPTSPIPLAEKNTKAHQRTHTHHVNPTGPIESSWIQSTPTFLCQFRYGDRCVRHQRLPILCVCGSTLMFLNS